MVRLLLSLCLCGVAGSTAHAAQTVLDLNEWGGGAAEHRALALFKSRVARIGQDAPALRLHYQGELGKAPQSLEKMMTGELDLVSGGLENFMPLIIDEVSGLTMPFLLPDPAATRAYLASPLMEEGREKVLRSRQIRFLVMDAARQPSRLILSLKPVRGAQDLTGMTVLVLPPPTNAGVRIWRKLGVTLAGAPGSGDLALVPGKLDAIVVAGLGDLPRKRLPAGVHYIGEIHDRPDLWTIAIREAVWQGWRPAVRDAVAAAAAEAGRTLTRQAEKDRAALLNQARDQGIEIGQVDTLAIHRGLEPLYASFIEYGDINPRVLQAAQAAAGD
jgi:TRAP-type C4-dicarboxylate transport system substrate-binding protein